MFNPMLPNTRSLLKKHLHVLHLDSDLKNTFLENSRKVFKRNRSPKEILSPSFHTKNKKRKEIVCDKELWKICYL